MAMRLRFLLLGCALFTGLSAAAAEEPVLFGDALYAKFQHPRCLQCHQFNSRKNNGRAYSSHRSRYLCDNCHTPRITGLARGEWMAPHERMDWTGLSARDTCLIAKRNMGVGDVDSKLLEHMLHDGRVHWALDNGMTPMGKFPAVPGGSEEWARDVRAWAASGMRCE
ncbi:MAG: hypothetical protein B7Y41_13600 [Hydrogenophilales bacterium 28-61-23]|nr:MAG: hypothetical protein B7Y41_13600 [Hydrogenophilales bacterium 28-61-23]